MALERHGNKQFSNGAMPSGVLKHPTKLTPEAMKFMRDSWYSVHGGSENAGKIAILSEGVEFQQTSQTNIDAQWLEAKKLNRVDSASLLNLPAHKLNALEDSSVRSNLEEQNEVYKQMTLTRWSNRMDEEFRRKLLTVKQWESDEYRFIFDWDAFLRADIDTLTSVGDRCVKAEIMNRNEARRLIGLAPYEGGEKFGSPAINPQPKEGEKPADPPDTGENVPKPPQNRLKTVENAHRELLFDRIQHLIEREGISLKQAANGAKNFVRWLDEFYVGRDGAASSLSTLAESIMGTSVRACLAAGIEARGVHSAVDSYAKTRHKQILEACSAVNHDELPTAIERLVGDRSTLVAQGLLATALNLEHEHNGAVQNL